MTITILERMFENKVKGLVKRKMLGRLGMKIVASPGRTRPWIRPGCQTPLATCCYLRPMEGFAIDRPDGRDDGEDWTENYEELPGGANISIILESTTQPGVGPRLHQHPYAETFIIRRGSATFTVGTEEFEAHAGQILVVRAQTPHKFATGADGYEGVHIHANVRFVTEWLE
jgi:mannose-6-phosphate isomerase-like protein (cupin superfamily)